MTEAFVQGHTGDRLTPPPGRLLRLNELPMVEMAHHIGAHPTQPIVAPRAASKSTWR